MPKVPETSAWGWELQHKIFCRPAGSVWVFESISRGLDTSVWTAELIPGNLEEGDGSQRCWLQLQCSSAVRRTPVTKALQKHKVWAVEGKQMGKGGGYTKAGEADT